MCEGHARHETFLIQAPDTALANGSSNIKRRRPPLLSISASTMVKLPRCAGD
jgi:hypothetical protein